jgi:hypothetical protein|tara:strand:+ start:862 stop:1497 length:636 start_codon:yes stop_codon:yes gene_type:complete
MKKYDNIFYFALLSSITFILAIISKKLLNSDELLINSLIEQFTNEQIESFLDFQEKWEWVSYCLIPLFLVLKISIIAAIIDIGCFFFNQEIKYKKLFNIVVKAEFIFLLVIIFKTTWFYIFQQNYTLEDLQYFYPLSALNIVGYQGLETWFIYPFQVLNLFEIAYWFILSYLIGKEINYTTEKGFSIVASSYGIGLLILVVGVMFLTLNMS